MRDVEPQVLTAQRVARMVRNGARLIPRASCLTQALSAQILLSRAGIGSRLSFGVKTLKSDQPFAAHAWLECQGQVILGGEQMGEFVPLDGSFTAQPVGNA